MTNSPISFTGVTKGHVGSKKAAFFEFFLRRNKPCCAELAGIHQRNVARRYLSNDIIDYEISWKKICGLNMTKSRENHYLRMSAVNATDWCEALVLAVKSKLEK